MISAAFSSRSFLTAERKIGSYLNSESVCEQAFSHFTLQLIAVILAVGSPQSGLLLRVAEKATLADDLCYLRWHHFIPALVPARDALEHVTRKDRQIFRVEIIELDEAAPAHQVIVEELQLGVHLKRTNSLELVSLMPLQGINIDFQFVLK